MRQRVNFVASKLPSFITAALVLANLSGCGKWVKPAAGSMEETLEGTWKMDDSKFEGNVSILHYAPRSEPSNPRLRASYTIKRIPTALEEKVIDHLQGIEGMAAVGTPATFVID